MPRAVPASALPEPSSHVVGSLGRGDFVPARSLVGRVPCLASHGLMDEGALAGALHAPPLLAGGLVVPGRGLRTATGAVGFTCALGVTVRGLNESARALLATAGPVVIVRGHTGPTESGSRYRSRDRSWLPSFL